MKVALALCGLAIFASSSSVAARTKMNMAAVDEPGVVTAEEVTVAAPEPQQPELTWEMLNPPGSSKYSLPMEYWDENTRLSNLVNVEPEPVVTTEIQEPEIVLTPEIQTPNFPLENLRGIPPDWLLQGRSGPSDTDVLMDVPEPFDSGVTNPMWVGGPTIVAPSPGLSGVPPPWVFRDRFTPADNVLPWLEALDVNADNVVTADEFTEYVAMLKGRANGVIDRGGDVKAMEWLKSIVGYHYANLQECLLHMSKSVKLEDLASVCSVKFRYSVLAGPAPFEWIARAQPEVAIEQVVNWYDAYFQTAILDIKSGRVNMGDAAATIESLEKYRACMKQFPASEMVTRRQYYEVVAKTQECATHD